MILSKYRRSIKHFSKCSCRSERSVVKYQVPGVNAQELAKCKFTTHAVSLEKISLVVRKPVFGVSYKSDTNRAAQP